MLEENAPAAPWASRRRIPACDPAATRHRRDRDRKPDARAVAHGAHRPGAGRRSASAGAGTRPDVAFVLTP